MAKDNIKKLLFTGVNLAISICLGLLVPRVLGAELYGQFTYITSLGVFFFQMVLLSFNNAFIYHHSLEIEGKSTINFFYLRIISILVCVFAVLTFVILQLEYFKDLIYPDIADDSFIVLGGIFASLTFFQLRLFDVFDAHKKVVHSEVIRVLTRFGLVIIISYLVVSQSPFSLHRYYMVSIFFALLSIVVGLKTVGIQFSLPSVLQSSRLLRSFWNYSRPLIYVLIISASYSFLGRYLLQFDGGSKEQGFYNFAYTVATMPVVFISSLVMLFSSDLVTALKNNKKQLASNTFLNFIVISLAVQLFALGLIVLLMERVVLVIVGAEFGPAIPVIYILSVFSTFHVFGVIATAVFNSAGENLIYAKLNISNLVAGVCVMIIYSVIYGFTAISLSLVVTGLYVIRSSIIFYKCLGLLQMRVIQLYFLLGGLFSLAICIILVADYFGGDDIYKALIFSLLYVSVALSLWRLRRQLTSLVIN